MTIFNKYQIEAKIYESNNSLVYRAINRNNNQPVILKILKEDYPTPEEIIRYKQEYKITKSLNFDGVIKTYDFTRYQNSLVMVLEDFGGESLNTSIAKYRFSLQELLTIAIKIVASLTAIHEANIVHKDINPSNIVYNRSTGQLKIIDFGISSILSRENSTIDNLDRIEGTLAYISPEQTGRMNRSIDYRSDFYSLGVTFYELFTNCLPFETKDLLELVHCHIAQTPVPLHLVKGERHCPKTVSDIIMKLMEKIPEERYQSSWGLKLDLETCLLQLQNSGRISEFAIAKQDLAERFEIPQKLYGRESEIAELLTTFERVSQGATEMMLVSGYSGIGKSALVNEIHKPIVRQRGYFISGKFDQLKGNMPYAGLIQAFQELISQLLTESESQLKIWQEKLLNALGNNGQVIIDIIPEIEIIIGKQPELPPLGAIETQNRFNLVLQKFVGVFTKKEHPLVIFLDDLQWADLASLKLLELLMGNRDSAYLLIIGAYRDNEVDSTHSLMLSLEQIKNNGARINSICLQNLNLNCVNQLIADTLKCSEDSSKPLAELIFEKTRGNPFFLSQLLQSLYRQKLLSFDKNARCWNWGIEEIQKIGITNNVVDLTIAKLKELDVSTQNVLKLAACIGNQFDLNVLALINQKSLSDTAKDLWQALQEGLILPLSNSYKVPLLWNEELSSNTNAEKYLDLISIDSSALCYKFLHDRIQEAAYALISEDYKKEVHLKVGRILLKNTESNDLEENIFDIVNQLNIGANSLGTQLEKDELARLNLIAGKRAKASIAYQTALRYLNQSLELLSPDSWQNNYKLTLDIYVEILGLAYLNARFDRAEKLADIILKQAKTILDRVKVYELKIQSYRITFQYQLAIETAVEALAKLGVSITNDPSEELISKEKLRLQFLLSNRSIESLAHLPEIRNQNQIAALKILLAIASAAFITNLQLFTLVVVKLVQICLEYGNSSLASASYVLYGLYLAGTSEDIEAGYRFGKLSLQLSKKFDIRQINALLLHVFNDHIKHWKDPAKQSIEALIEAVRLGIENGDLEYSGYAANASCLCRLFTGENLEIIKKETDKYTRLLTQYKQSYSLKIIRISHQTVLTLLEKILSDNKDNQIKEKKDKEILQDLTDTNSLTALYLFYELKSMNLYIFKNYIQAFQNSQLCKQYQNNAIGLPSVSQHNFYNSLSILSLYSNYPETKQKELLKQLSFNQKQMTKWAHHAPDNYQNKYDLVEAEKARVLGNYWQAEEFYEKAIQGAKKSEFIHEEAIAYERAAEFYFSLGREEIGKLYLKNSHHCYSQWGANAKVQALEEEYPEIFNQTSKRKNLDDPRSSINTKGEILDLQTVIKSYQALTSEIVLEKLLATLMRSLIENAGAQKSFLILKQDDRWTIEAEGKIESDEVNILRSLPINSVDSQNQTPIVPIKVINYVIRSKKNVVLDNASDDPQYNSDPYILYHRSKSVLSLPLLDRLQVTGVLYLENNLSTGVFTPDRVEFLKILAAQAAISIQNAQLYEERIKAEQALRQSEQQLTQFLEALPVGVFITTGEGKPYYLNQIAKQLIGQEVDDALSLDRLAESYNTYLAGSDRLYPREKSPIRKALRGESSYTPDMEIRSPDRDGEIIPLDIWTSPIVNQAGKVEYTISAFQDISDRKRLEEENLLLQQVGEDLSYSYQFGGGLAANAASYVVRKADRQLYQAILQSQYCYIFNARQMGKSSLRNKIMSQLASKTYRCGAIDLTGIGSSNLNPEQWYASLVLSLSQSLGIAQFDSVKNFASWWKSFNPISPIGKFKEFICEIVLKTIDSKIVIFIDELDSIKRLSFDTNDFLALIRFLYDNRPQNPDLNRLTFVLLGAANPSTLINDLRSTPFNIGSEITLEGFKIDEIQPLARGLSDLCDDSKTVLQEILAWTGGQPFLTQKICYLIKQSRQNITAGTEALAIAKLVREEIITNWKARDNPAHLQVIEQNVLNSPNKSNLLAIYREILEKQQIYLRDRHLKTELILSGLVCCQGDLLKVFNQMYASIFNLDWLDRNQN